MTDGRDILSEIEAAMKSVPKLRQWPATIVTPYRRTEQMRDVFTAGGVQIEIRPSAWMPDDRAVFLDRHGRLVGIIEFEPASEAPA